MTEKQAPHVEQALSEMAGAENEEQIKAAQKRLNAAGVSPDDAAKSRRADDGESRQAPPKARATRQEAKGATT
jgi:hypothetical protein